MQIMSELSSALACSHETLASETVQYTMFFVYVVLPYMSGKHMNTQTI